MFVSLPQFGTALHRLTLLLSIVHGCSGYPAEPILPFRLVYTPAHVVKHVTRDVTLRCEDDEYSASRLNEISRIRMLKKSATGWSLVAELRDNEDQPSVEITNVTVSAKIGQDVRETFLEVVWDVATEDTYGTYLCDIIGFDKVTYRSLTELTSEVTVFEENVTADDLLDVLRELKVELSSIKDKTNKRRGMLGNGVDDIIKTQGDQRVEIDSIKKEIDALQLKIDSVTGDVTSLAGNVDTFSDLSNAAKQNVKSIDTEIGHLRDKVNSMNENINSINETAKSVAEELYNIEGNVASFNGEVNALESTVGSVAKEMHSLKKKYEKLNGEIAYLLNLAKADDKTSQDSSFGSFGAVTRDKKNGVAWPGGWYALLLHKDGCPSDEVFTGVSDSTLKRRNSTSKMYNFFCETSGGFDAGAWPEGSYCINKVFGLPCPAGLNASSVDLSWTDSEYFIMPGVVIPRFEFCCKSSGSSDALMVLPTDNPFLLYRLGGKCQEIQGMSYAIEMFSIGNIGSNRSGIKTGVAPDVRITSDFDIALHLCVYSKL